MAKFQFIFGLALLLSLGLIRNVIGDCTNSDGSTCSGTDCCYDGTNGLSPVLGSGGGIVPVQECYTTGTGNGVTYTCTGDLYGPPFNQCNNGAWQFPFAPTCESVTSCAQPTVPTDGSITPDTPTYDFDTRITYACDDGYTVVGPSEAVCEWGGVWNPDTLPTCKGMCSPPVVDNSDYDAQLPPVDHASTITVNCDPGYSTGTGTDKDLTCSDGNFNDDPPVCYANCPPLSNFDNGVRSGDSTPFYHNEQVSYTCNNGFTLVGSTSVTCDDGDWNDDQPVCLANCPDFGMIEDGSFLGDTHPFYYEETVTFSCNTNHTLVGDDTLTCSYGNWTASIPSCEADCLPPVIFNSAYNTSNPQVTHGTDLMISCNTGYSTGQNETQYLTCVDGTLSPVPFDCLRDCTPPVVENSDYAAQKDPVFTSQSFIVTCKTNYTVGGGDSTATTTLTCNDGELDQENMKCYASCPDPGQPANGQYEFEGDGFYHGTVVFYYCNDRFDLEGESEIICTDGEWSGVAPNCTDKALSYLILLTCGPTSMEVEIPLVLLEGIGATDIGMEGDLGCTGYIEGVMMRVNTSLSGCGTNKTENSTYVTYTNRVVNNGLEGSRVVDVQIPLKCSYVIAKEPAKSLQIT